MADDASHYGLRARASQILQWFFGPAQQQQQQYYRQSDRLTQDGVDRGEDDPDNRRAVLMQQQAEQSRQRSPLVDTTLDQSQRQDATRGANLTQQAEQLRQVIQQQQAHQRGRGRGW